jgi:hypothetical protein
MKPMGEEKKILANAQGGFHGGRSSPWTIRQYVISVGNPGIQSSPPDRASLSNSRSRILDAPCAGLARLGVIFSFFPSFGHNALINLDSGKWIEVFGTIVTLFGSASCALWKRLEGT